MSVDALGATHLTRSGWGIGRRTAWVGRAPRWTRAVHAAMTASVTSLRLPDRNRFTPTR
jgi:hypothetical protein